MTKQAKGFLSWIFNRPTRQQKAEALAKKQALLDENFEKGIEFLSGKTRKK